MIPLKCTLENEIQHNKCIELDYRLSKYNLENTDIYT